MGTQLSEVTLLMIMVEESQYFPIAMLTLVTIAHSLITQLLMVEESTQKTVAMWTSVGTLLSVVTMPLTMVEELRHFPIAM